MGTKRKGENDETPRKSNTSDQNSLLDDDISSTCQAFKDLMPSRVELYALCEYLFEKNVCNVWETFNKVDDLLNYFAKPGWSSYSTVPGTVCAMIMQDISLPVGTTEDEKKHIWDGFIKKALNRMLTQSKNKITQDLRGQFNGMPFDMLSVCMNYFYSDTILVFPLAVEYGRPGALDTKALELYILETHARDFLASALEDPPSAGSKLLVDAILNYARHAAPKEETRKLMIHSKGVVKRTFELEGVAQEDGEDKTTILVISICLPHLIWHMSCGNCSTPGLIGPTSKRTRARLG
jgi:hypothetical protein